MVFILIHLIKQKYEIKKFFQINQCDLKTGVDSSATACIVASMCRLVCLSIKRGNVQTLSDVRKIVNDASYIPGDPKELCARIFVTCYMGTENSSVDTQTRARNLATDIGSYHLGMTTQNNFSVYTLNTTC